MSSGLDTSIERWRTIGDALAIREELKELRLGALYENGKGVPRDKASAVKWYRKAAEQGNALAKGNLKRLGL